MKHILANLDFEYELMDGERNLRGPLKSLNDRWSHILRLVPGWEDAEPSSGSDDAEVLVWGVTPSMTLAFPNMRWPATNVVERVNNKEFSHTLERELGCGLPGAVLVDRVETIEELLRVWPRVLIKHPLGVAGRERQELRAKLTEQQRAWIHKRLTTTKLICEPFVDIAREYSVQFQIGDVVEFLGWSELVTDAHGQHRGHTRAKGDLDDAILEPARIAAEMVAAEGYWGPLGIDAFRGTFEGVDVVRPVSEINARMTFGRLAIYLFEHDSNCVTWWHPSASRVVEAGVPLPEFCDPENRSKTKIIYERSGSPALNDSGSKSGSASIDRNRANA